MAKDKTVYVCQNCGAQSAKWIGKCPACGEWNSYVEEFITKEAKGALSKTRSSANQPVLLSAVEYEHLSRINTYDNELNRVLGGGLVPGSIVLIGGEPGIGKSTLLLQVALAIKGKKILYVTGEESQSQVKMRAERLGNAESEIYLLAETGLSEIIDAVDNLKPALVIIDSIQTLQSRQIESSPGSVSQVRECTNEIIKSAKVSGIPFILIGHITKEGTIAGPKVLEHMVDTVLQFEGDRHLTYRILRAQKNRFGSDAELGIYEMRGNGLREVSNPSEILISQREGDLSGVAIGAMMEGNRPLLIEVQALVTPASYGTPQRSSTGFDGRRLNMLLAVLEKKMGLRLSSQDVFLNIAGGMRIEDPAIDLAVCAAIASSFHDMAISPKACFAGEIGLGGEVRAVNKIENRIAEAHKLGFEEIYFSKFSEKGLDKRKFPLAWFTSSRLDQVFVNLF
jgi:DNA repair protein RadA/Sms